ncbi:hypothetical protein LYSHEL_11680 [Lysobacter helvus]|uniref:DUF4129 domain-containing protein n=2 Tax=Lysobacteraceae TaxID=32033 RepID=A0ABM7Q4A7_9GAMM|nr:MULTISPECIES: DUF4129 domain-containing protein [Lysobacter]BCT92144.1 hypothetical protein LYSCAS_11680 [Lysobacter caseinilyticus]BCT95297.1 hypothetical protein LYSHEL_11680 [Lysobacter helvus]
MRLDQVRIVLRPRSSWEAVELGMALVRRHFRAILRPWCLVTLPVFAVVNALGWWLDLLAYAPLVLWWLKPVFDRVPLFVLSRAVFGDAPDTRATLAAQRTWGWRAMVQHLTWRRLSPLRALYLPVDLLEGADSGSARRRVVGGSARGVATVVTLVCANFEFALLMGVLWLVPLFAPPDRFSDALGLLSWLMRDPPTWAHLGFNALYWGAMSVMEPFYVGAGFGLYLNRRTDLEAWDVELVFRRLRERLGGAAMVLLLVVGGTLAIAPPARADTTVPDKAVVKPKQEKEEEKEGPPTLPRLFGEGRASEAPFRKAVKEALDDPDYRRKETRKEWVRRDKPKPGTVEYEESPALRAISDFFGMLAESALWLLVVLVLLLLLVSRKRWLPWLQDMKPATSTDSGIDVAPLVHAARLPDDIPTAARALWREGRVRAALALLYRASVAAMVARTGARLVPGATEAECLRAARALQDNEDRDAFNAVVRTWQYAAYADRLPEEATFEAQLARMAERFGWSR